jgi:hypothetical protein
MIHTNNKPVQTECKEVAKVVVFTSLVGVTCDHTPQKVAPADLAPNSFDLVKIGQPSTEISPKHCSIRLGVFFQNPISPVGVVRFCSSSNSSVPIAFAFVCKKDFEKIRPRSRVIVFTDGHQEQNSTHALQAFVILMLFKHS